LKNFINNIQIKKILPPPKKKKVNRDEQSLLSKDYKISNNGLSLTQRKRKVVMIAKRKFMGISGHQMNSVSIYKQNMETNPKKLNKEFSQMQIQVPILICLKISYSNKFAKL
jgi:hypothetical protein